MFNDRAFNAAPTNPTDIDPLTNRKRRRGFRNGDMTQRQLQMLLWVEEGKSSADIGGILGLSPKTVDSHILKICAALGVKSRFQAVQKARRLGLLSEVDGDTTTSRSWVALPVSENAIIGQS